MTNDAIIFEVRKMTVWSVDGKRPSFDVRGERMGAGTVGGEHMQPKGLAATPLTAIIDDQDPRITYGALSTLSGSAVITEYASRGFLQNGTQTVLGGVQTTNTGLAAVFNFTGTSIGVLGSTNPNSGTLTVSIDGVDTPGRVAIFGTLDISLAGANTAPVLAGDTTITTLVLPAGFPASGTVLIGNELITYSGIGGGRTTLTGCVRGTNNTTASAHYGYENIYLWASSIDLYSTDYSTKRLLYYNPFLTPGQHRVVIRNSASGTGSYTGIYFDGFITGSLIGAKNMFTQLGSITVPMTTDGNGHSTANFQFAANNFDISPIAILGISQDNTTTSNTTILGKLGVTFGADGQPSFYLHNGPLSASFNLTITFMYIGESLS